MADCYWELVTGNDIKYSDGYVGVGGAPSVNFESNGQSKFGDIVTIVNNKELYLLDSSSATTSYIKRTSSDHLEIINTSSSKNIKIETATNGNIYLNEIYSDNNNNMYFPNNKTIFHRNAGNTNNIATVNVNGSDILNIGYDGVNDHAAAIKIYSGNLSPLERITIDTSGNIIFNEESDDTDFRIESNNKTHMFLVDGTNDLIGINNNTPAATLDIVTKSAATKGIIVKADASQSANMQEWQNSSGTALSYIDNLGHLYINTTNTDVQGNVISISGASTLSPSGALTAELRQYVLKYTSYWDTTQNGSSFGLLYGILGETITQPTATGALKRASGGRFSFIHKGTGTVTQADVVYSLINNNDESNETGDITNAYNYLAAAETNKGTGTITNRYGYFVADTLSGGNLTNQYGIYIEDMTAGGTLNHAIYMAGSGTGNDINWAGDTNLYRNAANVLRTDDTFRAGAYQSNDGTPGATGTFVDNAGNTITVKNGLITAFS